MNEFDQVIVNSRHNEDHILSISPSRRTFLSTSVGLLGLFGLTFRAACMILHYGIQNEKNNLFVCLTDEVFSILDNPIC